MTEWRQYYRINIAEMRPYVYGEDLEAQGISVSATDDPPNDMGMVARNPENHADQWYVARKYYEDNFAERSDIKRDIINTPELTDFVDAIRLEALHQRERWGIEHDSGKEPEDWFWLIGYLATKATQAHRYGDYEKYLHHIITCGAACLNWHSNASGVNTEMGVATGRVGEKEQ